MTMIALPYGWEISPRLEALWRIDAEHALELSAHSRTPDGRIRWRYRLARKGRTIFSGSDIRSSVGVVLSADELTRAARTVLAFLTLQSGDTDSDVFAGYTQTQLRWRDRWAEELSLYALDDLCGYCGSEDHPSPRCDAR